MGMEKRARKALAVPATFVVLSIHRLLHDSDYPDLQSSFHVADTINRLSQFGRGHRIEHASPRDIAETK